VHWRVEGNWGGGVRRKRSRKVQGDNIIKLTPHKEEGLRKKKKRPREIVRRPGLRKLKTIRRRIGRKQISMDGDKSSRRLREH